MKINKKRKKSNQTMNFDIEQLEKELIKPKQFSNEKSKSKSERKRK